jgi:hypothetical protein
MAVIPNSYVDLTTNIGQVLSAAGGSVNQNEALTYFQAAAKINDNSRYKPVSYGKDFEITDSDFYAVNWGFSIPTYSNYTEMKNAVKNGDSWIYVRPSGGSASPYRLGDFRRYDTESQVPFKMEASNASGVSVGGTLRLLLNEELTDIVKWDKFSGYQGTNIQYLNCGIYIPENGYYFPFTDTNQGLSMNDLDWEKLSITIPSNLFRAGNSYTAYLVLTTWDGANGGRTWYLPSESDYGSWWVMKKGGEVKFTVVNTPNPLDYININGYGSGNYSYVGGYYAVSGINLSFEISASSSLGSTTGTLSVSVVIPNHYEGGTTVSSKTIASFSVPNVTSGFSTTKSVSGSNFNLLTSKEDSVNANMILTYVAGGKTYTETRGIVIELSES